MRLWFFVMLAATALAAASAFYVGIRLPRLFCVEPDRKAAIVGVCAVLGAMTLVSFFLSVADAAVCVFYVAAAWLACDALACFSHVPLRHSLSAWTAVFVSLAALVCGWQNAHGLARVHLVLASEKVQKPFRIALFADAHVGTTFGADGFAERLKKICEDRPDAIAVVGDFVDDKTTREDMLAAAKALGGTGVPTLFAFGNHDMGYRDPAFRGFTGEELAKALKEHGVTVLMDEAREIDGVVFAGRRDRSMDRMAMDRLMRDVDRKKYVVVLDHQPNDFAAEETAHADLVFCGHTHGGQLWPLNQAGKWLGAVELVYGHERRGKTDFVVTSGMADWALHFKTGTKSEYVIIDVSPRRQP